MAGGENPGWRRRWQRAGIEIMRRKLMASAIESGIFSKWRIIETMAKLEKHQNESWRHRQKLQRRLAK
jgi:hypothetical protein